MRIVNTVGTLLYYGGLGVMLIGLAMLIAGVSETLTSVMGEVRTISSDGSTAPCNNPPCSLEDPEPESMSIPEAILNSEIDKFMGAFGLAETTGSSQGGMFYNKFRRFFAFMGIGIILVVLGVLLRAFDSFEKYLEGRQKKQPLEERYRMRSGGRPEKNWTKYVRNDDFPPD